MKPLITLLLFTFFFNLLYGQHTFYVKQHHPTASDENPGSNSSPFKTIGKAASIAGSGDTVIVSPGTYRERVAPLQGGTKDRPVVYRASAPGKVVVKGSDVWSPDWILTDLERHIFRGIFPPDFFRQDNPKGEFYEKLPEYFNPFQHQLRQSPVGRPNSLGQVFVDGKPYREVCSQQELEKVPESWLISKDGKGVSIHFGKDIENPSDHLVEISTRSRVFAPYKRGLGYIHVIGFVFEHGATNFPYEFWTTTGSPQAGIVGCRGGHHWKIENNTIRYGKSLGLDIGYEGPIDIDSLGQEQSEHTGYHIIRNNTISDNGCGGIAGIGSYGTQIIGNTFERNNRLGFSAPEIGGVKLHFFIEGRIEGNLFRNNYCYGLWLDNVWRNSRVTRNTFVGNQGAGIFIELGDGPLLVDNNVIALTHNTVSLAGDGIYSHDASGVILAHNLIYFNSNYGLWYHLATDRETYDRNEGKETPARASHWKVVNNIFIGNHVGAISMPAHSARSRNNMSDNNLFTSGYPRLTSETYAAKLDNPYFSINTNKGRQDLGKTTNLPEDYLKKPFLTMGEWQLKTGHDKNSMVPIILRPMLNYDNLLLNFFIDNKLKDVRCERIEEIMHDFEGNIMTEDPIPGPFQNLIVIDNMEEGAEMISGRGRYNHIKSTPENANTIFLWPKEIR